VLNLGDSGAKKPPPPQVQIPFFMIKQSNDMIALIDGHDQRL